MNSDSSENKPGTVGIALCCYNGMRYLPEQLDSILEQNVPPDHIFLQDDGSTDGCFGWLGEYLSDSDVNYSLWRNTRQLGATPNFCKLLGRTWSDHIALCDQDDVWCPDKLAVLAAELSKHGDTTAVFSDAIVVDQDLCELGYTMWRQTGFSHKRQQLMRDDNPWKVLFKDPVVSGCTMMFRRDVLKYALPIPDVWWHDAWIAQIASALGPIIPVDRCLVKYRQHGNNAIGGLKRSIFQLLGRARELGRRGLAQRELRRYEALQERLGTMPRTNRVEIMLEMCTEKIAHLECRLDLPRARWRRIPVVLSEVLGGNYARYAKDWRIVAGDLFLP